MSDNELRDKLSLLLFGDSNWSNDKILEEVQEINYEYYNQSDLIECLTDLKQTSQQIQSLIRKHKKDNYEH